ncbi:MAG: DMT family transporter [Promethearchaeota archaeon]|nr:MAG: DMT family transporter [Candidatus Lokiarchaeota archaeon]
MNNENYEKGIIFALGALFLVGLQPIIANSRPLSLDPYFFAATTCIVEAIIFFPLMLIERKRIRLSHEKDLITNEDISTLLNGWKDNKILLIYIGINFGIAQVLFFWGYQLAGAINGSLSQKTVVIFGLLFGYLINKEKVRYPQIIFSLLLFFGLVLAVTAGKFNLLEFNIGVLLIIITATLWMLAHSLTKPILDKNEATPVQLVFIRNFLSGLFLISTYFIFFPIENIFLIFDSISLFFIILMGLAYGLGLFCWYKVLTYLGTSKGSAITSGTPIVTIIFATIILGEIFTIFHIIGTLLVIFSVLMIVRPRKDENK